MPDFEPPVNLPPGVHWATWKEMDERFGRNPHRRGLISGLREAILALRMAGCRTVYLDGSFVTAKEQPNDFEACCDFVGVDQRLLDPVFLDFSNKRAAQKARFQGEIFPARLPEGASGRTFLEFFQTDRNTGDPKGIVALDLRRLDDDQE